MPNPPERMHRHSGPIKETISDDDITAVENGSKDPFSI